MSMNRQQRRAAQKYLEISARVYGSEFVEFPESQWPASCWAMANPPFKVWRNNIFLVQAYQERNEIIRLSVNKAHVDASLGWLADIKWEELQSIKNAVGFEDFNAVEIYPAQIDEVNVANMRHLWVLPQKLAFGWRRS